ncbi:MAG TPA: substrate-binding domain-containing protein [Streptosporangiaceae bacterium]|nr:substrate-binding domain-containing protein [Streptosporangiaceae bacterium]
MTGHPPSGRRRPLWLMLSAGLAAVLLTACGGASTGSSGAGDSGSGSYTIALSNSYIGNSWRVEMENEFKAACRAAPLAGKVKCPVYNANNDVSAQKQQISDLIASGVDAIVTDAASPTGLNNVIQQACGQHILVVSFDNTVTAPCALKVNENQYQMGYKWAQWLAGQMHGHGNVLMITGVAGTYVNQQRNAGAMAVWKKYPGIHVVDQLNGQWDSQVAEQAVASALPTLPKIDGIWCQGGTNGALEAFQQAGRSLPPTAGEAENGFRQLMAQKKVTGYSIGQAPYLGVTALGLAQQILSGKLSKASYQTYNMPLSPVTNATNTVGSTWFKNVNGDFFADIADTSSKAPVKGLCLAAAKSGAACPAGKLTFSFSS